jgi:cobalt-zinc-cadmium efflux system outer membrane protein
MSLTRFLPLTALLVLSGCLYGVREKTEQVQCDLSMKPYDLAPRGQATLPRPAETPEKAPAPKPIAPGEEQGAAPAATTDVQTALFLQAGDEKKPLTPAERAALRLKVPDVVPGSGTQLPDFRGLTEAQRREAIRNLFPDFPPLSEMPVERPGPGGKPLTLADLQQLAARYRPELKQFAADVETARGNMLQARAYPNPTLNYGLSPSANGLSSTVLGISLSQPIKTGGKLHLQEAAAEMVLANAELALRRARSDVATQVRNAYFGFLVAREAMRVNRGIARLTNEVFLIQRDLSESFAAPYEAGTLRGQADVSRLAYETSVFAYLAAWRQLVAALGLRRHDMPLSQVAGRVDAFVPIYDQDKVLARVLSNHTDILAARNTVDQAGYNLKLQQISPWFQDLVVSVGAQRDFTIPPGTVTPTVTVAMPLSVWDQNKGNIIAAEGALARALEQQHASELTWTTSVAAAFSSYRQNLLALETYRRTTLPTQVMAYKGVFTRRAELGAQGRTPVAFADVVTAQQTLTASVTTYLGILGSLWSAVVSVADPLQTDDLFQLAEAEALPPVPDLDHLLPLPCGHDCPPAAAHGEDLDWLSSDRHDPRRAAGAPAPCPVGSEASSLPAPAPPRAQPSPPTSSEARPGGTGQ